MKVCVIGSSGHVNYVLEGLGEGGGTLIGVAPGSDGEDVSRLRAEAENHPVKQFADYRAMLDELKPDVVAVACHFGDHAKVSMEVLKRGIHVFVEKPIATSFRDLSALRKTYESAGVHLAAMFGIRCTPWFLTVHERIQSGAIGKVRLLTAQKSYKLGVRPQFFQRRDTYGGTIPWVGSHAIDWLHWLSGEKFISVFASHSRLDNRGNGELEMTGLCHFVMTNEVYGSVNIDYLRPAKALSHGDDRVRVVGTSGIIEVRHDKVYLINDENDGAAELPLMTGKRIFADFLKQVRGEGRCLVSAEDSFYITDACLRARLSADCKRIVSFDENLCEDECAGK